MKLKTLLYLVPHSPNLFKGLLGMRNQEILPTRKHLALCRDYFLFAQTAAGGGGYSASYSLITGLRHAYIETTGYIIPTMFDLAVCLGDPKCRASALKAGEWLLSVQQADGSFTDIDQYLPQVFDTGQVMLGLNRLFRETNDGRFLAAARRAADWLVKVQDPNGSWTTMSYHRGHPCTYLTRSAAALLETWQLTKDPKHHDGAVEFLRWAASRQQANGFFLNCELRLDENPVLHTMVYVLEGFWMAHRLTGEREWLDVVMRGALPLRKAQLERDLVPCSQYDANFQVSNPEKCVPGVAQWAGLCLALYEITKEPAWLEAAKLSVFYLKSKQLRGRGLLHGALPASVPLWGHYHPMMFPNWAVKFFTDALLLYVQHHVAVWQEQEAWVRKCFELQLDGGGWKEFSDKLGSADTIIIGEIESAFADPGVAHQRVLDVGCGSGRFMRELRSPYPQWQLARIDPGEDADREDVRTGSAYGIPFEANQFNGAFSFFTLQHVSDIRRALSEVKRILKPGGTFVVCDRNPISARGVLKTWHELRGRWMYPWDSPFRERWYTVRRWKLLLREAGLVPVSVRVINDPDARGIRRVIPTNRFLMITAKSLLESEERAMLEQSWRPRRLTVRWWLEQWNHVLRRFNLRLDTLTAAKNEKERLRAVAERGGFTAPMFPLPRCFTTSEYRTVLDALPTYRSQLARLVHAEDNEVNFTYDNSYYKSPDAEVLYTIIRQRRPERILEIGCGNSTRVIRQAILDGKLRSTLVCIDPYPREELSTLADEFVRARVETQDAAVLAGSLHAGDVLFIDTSHEVRVANDIAYIFGCLIPRLRPGVIIHIHDIFLPYEYPRHWVLDLDLQAWGEQYVVQAMLAESSHWKAIWPGYYLQRTLMDFAGHFPNCGDHFAQSLWIEKTTA